MFTVLLLNLNNILQNILLKFSFVLFILIVYSFCLSQSASISTLNYHSNQYQLMSNNSYRNFILRQYFIDLLNISHTSLVRSMIYNQHLTKSFVDKARRKRFIDDTSFYTPMFTLQSSNCLMIDKQVQSIFIWSHSTDSLSSIELIYHIDLSEIKNLSIPLYMKFKDSKSLIELYEINTYLQFDLNRDFYSINIYEYLMKIQNQNIIIETIINNETCQTSHAYIILSSKNLQLKSNPTLSYDLNQLKQSETDEKYLSKCKLKTIQIKFEDLGLAYLIIRPKEYTFTYCDGSCFYHQQQQQLSQTSMHAVFQSILNRNNPNIPQPSCVPSQFADDNFLLRQIDGSLEIYPIKNVLVKQCACL